MLRHFWKRHAYRSVSGSRRLARSCGEPRLAIRPRLECLEDRLVPSTSIPLSSTSWTALGPAPLVAATQAFSGRVTGVAADPTQANILYIATAGGGVWKTVDGGASWAPLTDNQQTLFMGAIAVAPSNPGFIYAGTGEANLTPSQTAQNRDNIYYGLGVLRSTDAGATWALMGNGVFNRRSISKIAIDPTNANVVYVAVGEVATNGLTGNQGIWKTTDGGVTWTDTTSSITTTAAFSDVVIDPANPQILYGAVGEAGGNAANGIYKTTDGGFTWVLLGNFPHGSTDSQVGRITVAISANSHLTIYASIAASGQGGTTLGNLLAMEKTNDGGSGWAFLTTPNFMGTSGDYDTALVVSPTNSNVVYASGASGPNSVLQTIDGGLSWTNVFAGADGFGPHGNHHASAMDAIGRYVDGNDGGVWRLDNATPGSLSWTDLNANLNTVQFTGVALDPTNPNVAYGAGQSNGTDTFSDSLTWNQALAGNGGFVRVDPASPNIVYTTLNYSVGTGFLQVSGDGGASWNGATNGINTNDPANYYPPYVVAPANANELILGTNRVYISVSNAGSWTPISTVGVNGWSVSAIIDSLVGTSDGSTIYASAGGHVFVTNNLGSSWTLRDPINPAPAGLRWRGLAVDPANPAIAYAVAGNFNSGTGGGHVFRTTNFGASWTNISGNFPDLPARSIALNTQLGATTIYVGTDAGVYASSNLGATWAVLAAGLPNVQVDGLEVNTSLGIVAASTAGRGMWELSLQVTALPTHVLAAGADAGGAPMVSVFDASNGGLVRSFLAYAQGFAGGVRVAVADLNGDGIPDIITAPGPSGGPDVRVFDGQTGQLIREFMAYDPRFLGGVYLAAGDVNGDGVADIVTGADRGGGPQVEAFSGTTNALLLSFYAYSPNFTGGVRVAAADVNGDGHADIVTGAGPGGGPHVEVFSGLNGGLLRSFYAYAPNFTGGVYVGAGDVNGDHLAEIATGAGAGGGPQVNIYNGADNALLEAFYAFAPNFHGGVRVELSPAAGDTLADIVAGAGPGGGPQVVAYNGRTLAVLDSFYAFDSKFSGGIFVGGN